MKRLNLILGTILIVLFISSCNSGNTPTNIAEKSMKCLIDKDYDGYADLIYFSEDDIKDAENLKQAKEQLAILLKDKADKEYKKKNGITSYKTISEEIADDGNTANVKMKVIYGNGSNDETDIKLRKDKEGKWKIDLGK